MPNFINTQIMTKIIFNCQMMIANSLLYNDSKYKFKNTKTLKNRLIKLACLCCNKVDSKRTRRSLCIRFESRLMRPNIDSCFFKFEFKARMRDSNSLKSRWDWMDRVEQNSSSLDPIWWPSVETNDNRPGLFILGLMDRLDTTLWNWPKPSKLIAVNDVGFDSLQIPRSGLNKSLLWETSLITTN